MDKIEYRSGFKYQLARTYTYQSPLLGYECLSRYIKLSKSGMLRVYAGYAWDGPSGPTIDTKNFMRGALLHDALYQLIREGKLPANERSVADRILKTVCKEDGMSSLRAWYVHKSVSKMAGFAADPQAKKKILTAP